MRRAVGDRPHANVAARRRVARCGSAWCRARTCRRATSTPTRCLAQRPDLDAVLHLGDYIYEYANAQYGDGTQARPRAGRRTRRWWRCRTIASGTRSTRPIPIRRKIHRQHPFIVIWDDHEFANNTWRGGAQNHNNDGERRRVDARARRGRVQAYFEWMPIREDAQTLRTRIYRTFRFGNWPRCSCSTRGSIGRDQQVAARRHRRRSSLPSRQLLGAEQEGWLAEQLVDVGAQQIALERCSASR